MKSMQSTIAIFPLPNIILFQGCLLPLHIFEPRYRMMIDYTLECDSELGITSINSRSEIESVFGWGKIIKHESLEDGRSNIILEGFGIAKILDFDSTDPFIIANVEKIPNTYSHFKEKTFQSLLEEILILTKKYFIQNKVDSIYFIEIEKIKTLPFPIEFISSLINFEYSLKQDILVTLDPYLKARKLLDILYKLIK